MIHYLDVDCADCGARAGFPCKRALYPHKARQLARDEARGEDGWLERQLDRIEDQNQEI